MTKQQQQHSPIDKLSGCQLKRKKKNHDSVSRRFSHLHIDLRGHSFNEDSGKKSRQVHYIFKNFYIPYCRMTLGMEAWGDDCKGKDS